jgi:hypothetical protein
VTGWARRLLIAALSVMVAGAVFSSACTVIWPEHWPAWVARVSSAGLLGGVLLTAAAASLWIARRSR